MEFIVASHAHLITVEVNEAWEVQTLDVLNTGHHYGLAPSSNEGDAARLDVRGPGGNAMSRYERNEGASPESARFRRTASYALGESASQEAWGAVHQIAFCNGGLYLTNTRFNSLVFLTEDGEEHVYHFEDVDDDRNHVNSVFPSESGQVAVMLHNKGRGNSEMAMLEHGREGFRLLARIPLWDKSCHNIFVEDGRLAYNASKYGDLVVASLDTGNVVDRLHFSGHTKGLSVTSDYFIVGHSEHAVREARKYSAGTMEVIDRDSLQKVATVNLDHEQLERPIGNVNEIRCVSEPEFGHTASDRWERDWKRLRLFTNQWSQQLGLRLRQLRSLVHWPRPVWEYVTGAANRRPAN